MKTLEISATKSSPEIIFNAMAHTLLIAGESYPENTAKFYAPIFKWLENYIKQIGNNKTILNVELIYFNSSSSKALMDIFDMLDDASRKGKNITLNWIYDQDNDAALEYGEEFAEDIEHLVFNLVQKDC
ncbi:MAG: DUF1987 domain-containing protein [Pseudomonadota bacterium]